MDAVTKTVVWLFLAWGLILFIRMVFRALDTKRRIEEAEKRNEKDRERQLERHARSNDFYGKTSRLANQERAKPSPNSSAYDQNQYVNASTWPEPASSSAMAAMQNSASSSNYYGGGGSFDGGGASGDWGSSSSSSSSDSCSSSSSSSDSGSSCSSSD